MPRFIVAPRKKPEFDGHWVWQLVDGETGEVFASGEPHTTPGAARHAAKEFRRQVYMATIEMGT